MISMLNHFLKKIAAVKLLLCVLALSIGNENALSAVHKVMITQPRLSSCLLLK